VRLALLLSSYLQTRYRRFATRAQLLAWQDRQVQRFLGRMLPRSPFHARRFAGRGLADWATLPVMDKAGMMAGFDDLNTVGIRRDDALALALRAEQTRDFAPTLNGVTVGLSSGTSGSRGLFLVSPEERWRWAGAVLARTLPGSLLGAVVRPQRVAFFLRANSNLYTSVRSRLMRFEYFDLLDPLPQHLARLNALRPTVLVAPPSMLRLLGEAVDQLHARPAKLISVAEVLDPLDQAFIEKQFGLPVHQVYQATEGFLAATCRYGTLHLNEDLLVVQREYLDEACRKFVPIITDFHRISQPIIRYRLDDVLTERAEPCPCGSMLTALESIDGRCDDLYYFAAANDTARLVTVFPDFIRRAVITAAPAPAAYVAVQRAPGLVEIGFTAPAAERAHIARAITANMEALCARLGCLPPRLVFGPEPARNPARKLKRVERAFHP
jgi:putative adenylate-forming enzyme